MALASVRFVGTMTVPERCPRERCGQPVSTSFPLDHQAPGTWSCSAGHGGVLNTPPDTLVPDPPVPTGLCRRCRLNQIPSKRVRGGHRGHFCTDCIEEGRREFGT